MGVVNDVLIVVILIGFDWIGVVDCSGSYVVECGWIGDWFCVVGGFVVGWCVFVVMGVGGGFVGWLDVCLFGYVLVVLG